MKIEKNIKIEKIEFKIEAEKGLQQKWRKWIEGKTSLKPGTDILPDIIAEKNEPNEISRYFSRAQTDDLLLKVVIPNFISPEDIGNILDILKFYGRLYTKTIEVKEKKGCKLKTLFFIGDKSTSLLVNL